MTFEKLNNAYRHYKENPTEPNFADLYSQARTDFLQANRAKMVIMGYLDTNDADSVFDDAVWKAANKDDLDNFGLWLRTSLRNERIDFVRAESRRRKRIAGYINEDVGGGKSASTLILKTEKEEVENEVFYSEEKKRTNQRQLVSSLLEPLTVQSDPFMSEIIERVKSGESPGAIAKSHGLERNTVVRKIRHLSRHYDRQIYGDITDYLPVGLRIRREFISA